MAVEASAAGDSAVINPSPAEVASELRPVLPLVARHADWTNEHRRPHPEVFEALAGTGLLRLIAPSGYGGLGGGPGAFLAMVETLARVDGSAAWTAMTVNEEVGIACSYLAPESMTELLTDQPDVIIAGSGVALGRAERVDGGWLITGRWGFISGVPVADRVILTSRIRGADADGDSGDPTGAPGHDGDSGDDGDAGHGGDSGAGGQANGSPSDPHREPIDARRRGRLCFTLIPVAEIGIEDTWHTAGLRGTGSNDVVADGLFVPDRWAGVSHFGGPARPDTPYYRLPNGLRFPWPKVGVAAGVARAAMEAFDTLARSKKPSFLPELLAERPNAQLAAAEAEALVGSGLAWVLAVLDELWEAAAGPGPLDPALHARARLAASYAVDSAIHAVDGLASAAGTTAGKLDGPWPRLQADVRSVSQHFMVGPQQMQTAGRVLLGQPANDPAF